MPRMEFDEKNKSQQVEAFNKLKLKKGERKRILCVEDPVVNYVHNIRAPKIVNNEGIKKTEYTLKGQPYETFVQDFISNPICLGDFNALQDNGADPKNCPACAASLDVDNMNGPKRRFAMHVIVYKTKPGGWDLAVPFNVDLVVWSFTDQVFNKLIDLQKIQGDLRKHDLFLGECTEEVYQKYEITAGPDAAWLSEESRKVMVKETYAGNQIPDLDIACGRKSSRDFIEADVNKAVERWKIATGTYTPTQLDLSTAKPDLSTGLDDLISDVTTPEANTEDKSKAKNTLSFDELLADLN